MPGLHAPLYAASTREGLTEQGLHVDFLPPVAREDRLQRIRAGRVDLILMDLASLIDSVAQDPDFPGRCVFVLTQRLPMAAFFLRGRRVSSCRDLPGARLGGPEGTAFVAEYRALVRRLPGGMDGVVEDIPYDRTFSALAEGRVDVVADYAGIIPRFRRTAGPEREIGVLPFRDCGVLAYGIGFVATEGALTERRGSIVAFLEVAREAYRAMRRDPEDLVEQANFRLPELDRAYALEEWRAEEEEVIFGYEGLGASSPRVWEATADWRSEVSGREARPEPARLYEPLL